MLASIDLENYRGHQNTKIPLDRFTLLVGDNGAGKSNVLNAAHYVGQVFKKDPKQIFSGERQLPLMAREGSDGPLKMSLTGKENDIDWSFSLISEDKEKPEEMKYSWSYGEQKYESLPLIDLLTAKDLARPPPPVRHAQSAVVLRLNAHQIAAPSTSDEEKPRIEYDGSGRATALQYLKLTDLETFQKLEAAIRKVVPALKAISFERVRKHELSFRWVTIDNERVQLPENRSYIADAVKLQFQDTAFLPAYVASEGTLLVLALLSFLHMPKRPRLFLLDDIGRGLHPRAQAQLVEAIREMLELQPTTQVLATTHSPYLADSFKPSEVVVLGRPAPDGPVVARRLSEDPDQKLLKSLTTGEFLAASGKDWFAL